RNNFLSLSTLKMIADLKQQFLILLKDIGFAYAAKDEQPGNSQGKRKPRQQETEVDPIFNEHASNLQLIKAVLCAGLYPHVIRIEKVKQIAKDTDNESKAKPNANTNAQFYTKQRGQVFLHPSSTLFKLPTFNERWLIYHEKVKTSKVYIRDGTL